MTQQRDEREKRLLETFPKGAIVRVKDPDRYIASVASKLQDRLGEVTGHQIPTPNPIVTFPAIGRKKVHRQVFSYCTERDLEVVTDGALIAVWQQEIEKTNVRHAKQIEDRRKQKT